MSSELNMYEAQVKEYKYEIERLAKELQEVKKKFYMQKRKEQQARERDRAYQQATGPAFSSQRTDGARFTGGGFNLKPPAKAVA